MLKIELYKRDNIGDPPACFASDAEIEIADRLRHQLEQRYLDHRRHTYHCRFVRAKTIDSIHRMPHAVRRKVAGPSEQPEA
jgi:hypothetical protein